MADRLLRIGVLVAGFLLGWAIRRPMKTCTKVRYRDRVAALTALARLEMNEKGGGREKRERRAYRCPDCRGWHLTSKRGGGGSA